MHNSDSVFFLKSYLENNVENVEELLKTVIENDRRQKHLPHLLEVIRRQDLQIKLFKG